MSAPAGAPPPGSALPRIFHLLLPHRGKLSLAALGMLFAGPITHLHPLIWQVVIDQGVLGRDASVLLPCLAAMLLSHVGGTVLGVGVGYLSTTVSMEVAARTRCDLHRKLMGQSVTWFHDRPTGDLMARVTGDVEQLQMLCTNFVGGLVQRLLGCLFMAAALVWINPGLAALGVLPLVAIWFLVRFYNSRALPANRVLRERFGEVSSRLQEDIQGVPVVKAFAREDSRGEGFAAVQGGHTSAYLRSVWLSSLFSPTVTGLNFLGSLVIAWVGIHQILRGEFTLGGLVAFRNYLWSLVGEVQALTALNEILQRSLAASERIFEVLDAPEMVADAPDAATVETITGRLVFRGVAFGYRPDRQVLSDIDFTVPAGRRLAVVGPSGAGKSTLIGLTLRFFDPTSGTISVDGRDLRSLRQREYRRFLGVVSQEPFLFSGTVRENLLLARPGADEAEIQRSLKLANAADFVAQLPEQLETKVGERGVKLSVGQKQRICVARAFLADPRILLLDEATASVEPESEALIQSAIERLMEGRTAVVVTHRLSMARSADMILVIEGGTIRERGTHAELLGAGGWYARMHAIQAADATPARAPGAG